MIGHQWWWEFRYPQYGVITANELYLPVGRTVNFTLKTSDVIHSFWIPQLGGKRDLISNHTNHLWFTPDSIGGRVQRLLRRVLRHVAREHALQGVHGDAGRVRAAGSRTRRRRPVCPRARRDTARPASDRGEQGRAARGRDAPGARRAPPRSRRASDRRIRVPARRSSRVGRPADAAAGRCSRSTTRCSRATPRAARRLFNGRRLHRLPHDQGRTP